MTRTRFLKPGFFKNEELAALPFEGRLLFQGLWLMADREGRLEDRPNRIKAEVFPFDPALDINALLAQLASTNSIERYRAGFVAVIQVVNFGKHQHPHPREIASVLPPKRTNQGQTQARPRPRLGQAQATPKTSGSSDPNSNSDPLPAGESREATGADAAAAPSPALLTFPCIGQGAKTWALTWAQVEAWREAYPHLDIESECRKALVWVQADGVRRKTAGGMGRFLVRWLNRAVDDRRSPLPAHGATTGAALAGPYVPFACPHDPECHGRAACLLKTQLNALKGNGGPA